MIYEIYEEIPREHGQKDRFHAKRPFIGPETELVRHISKKIYPSPKKGDKKKERKNIISQKRLGEIVAHSEESKLFFLTDVAVATINLFATARKLGILSGTASQY